MATDKSVLSLDIVTNVNDIDQDTLLTIISSKLVRIKWSSLVNMIGSWDKVSDKPFDDFDGNHFTIENSADGRSILSLTDNIANKVHLHTNKDVLDLINVEDGLLTYQGTPVIDFTKWETVKEKPFGSLSDDFTVVQKALTISPAQKHTNKDVLDGLSDVDGELQYNGYPIGGGGISEWKANKKYYKNDVVIQWNALWQCRVDADPQSEFVEGMWQILSNDWSLMTNRPFKYLSSDFTVDENDYLHINSDYTLPIATTSTLGGVKPDGTTITVDEDGTIHGASQGLDFEALTTAITTGTQSGISITADTENSRFDFEVTGIPTITIDSDGYWNIDGERGENPTKAQGEKGTDGISPTAVVSDTESGAVVTITDKNGTTAVEIFDGTDGVSPTVSVAQTETGCTITVTDGSGTTIADLTNGKDGTTPHIDETTNHWFVGDVDTGVGATAFIDDTSTDGTDVCWSASKINSVIGDINTILASVTGGIT